MTRQMLATFLYHLIKDADFTEEEEYPKVKGMILETPPKKVVAYDHINDSHDSETWLHFYVNDNRFLPLYSPQKWEKTIAALQSFGGVFGIDHSLHYNFPLPEHRYSLYLNRLTDHAFECANIPVVPNVSWSDDRSFDFFLDGLPIGTSIAISSHGCAQGQKARMLFLEGVKKTISGLHPYNIFHYGHIMPEVKEFVEAQGVPIFQIPTRQMLVYGKKSPM